MVYINTTKDLYYNTYINPYWNLQIDGFFPGKLYSLKIYAENNYGISNDGDKLNFTALSTRI